MGLRDFLANLQGVTAATAGAAESTGKLREQLAMQQYAQQLPGIIQSGDQGQLAGAAAQAQDLPTLRALIANSAKFQQKEKPASEPYRKTIEGIVGKPLDPSLTETQLKEIGGLTSTKQKLDQNQSQFEGKEGRLNVNKLKDDAAKFAAPLMKTEKEINESVSGLEASLNSFKQKASPQALNLVIRSVIKASGDNRVSDQDIAGLNLRSGLPNQIPALSNFLQGKTAETLTPDQKNEVLRIADTIVNTAESRKQRVLGAQYLSQVNAYPQLVEKDHPSVASFAEKLGLEKPTIDENGIVRTKKRGQKVEIPADSRLGKLTAMADKIKDPKRKQQALNALGKYSNETLDPGKEAEFKSLIEKFAGGN